MIIGFAIGGAGCSWWLMSRRERPLFYLKKDCHGYLYLFIRSAKGYPVTPFYKRRDFELLLPGLNPKMLVASFNLSSFV